MKTKRAEAIAEVRAARKALCDRFPSLESQSKLVPMAT
jgi:hypothetical protein